MSVQKGDSVRNFTLPDSEGKDISLEDLLKRKKVLLFFFPMAFSGTCAQELSAIRNNMKLYDALKTAVAAISVDSYYVLKEFKKANNLNFPLLSDFNKKVSGEFGCLYENYKGMKGVAKRAAFVINQDFEIEYAEVLEDADQLPDFKKIQSVLAQ